MNTTVGELLDDMDRARGVEPQKGPAPADPFIPATLEGVPPLPAPGIYFGMPFEEYRNLPALGSHGVADILASPMIFWAKHAWLSETARKQAERPVSASTAMTRLLGEAYHARLLEGPEAYAARYAVELSEDACKGALESTDQIKAAIRAHEHKPVSKVEDVLPDGSGQVYERGAVKDDWVKQLLAIDPAACILSELRRKHGLANAGKQFLPFDAHEQIEIAAAMIEADPGARHALHGGHGEVTLIAHDPETGVPLKARVDYLKIKAMVDLKTMDIRGRSASTAAKNAMNSYRYNYQPSMYWKVAELVKAVVRGGSDANDGMGPIVSCYADGLPAFNADVHNARLEWARKWAAQEAEPDFWFLFQNKGEAPVTRLIRYDHGLSTAIATDELLRQACRRFRDCSEHYGTTAWFDIEEPSDFTDDDFRDYIVQI